MTKQTFDSDENETVSFYRSYLNNELSKREEISLAQRAQQGDKAARDQLILAHLRLVVNTAKCYEDQGVPLDDLISIGTIELLNTIRTFDYKKGKRLYDSVRPRVNNVIQHAVWGNNVIKFPIVISEIINKLKRTLKGGLQDEIIKEIAKRVNLEPEDLMQLLILSEVSSYDRSLELLYKILSLETDSNDVEVFIDQLSLHKEIRDALKILTPRERQVIELRFGFVADYDYTIEEVAKKLKVSGARVWQIEVKAIRKLRHPSVANALWRYLHPDA